jgi:hypothetical protein
VLDELNAIIRQHGVDLVGRDYVQSLDKACRNKFGQSARRPSAPARL